MPADTPQRSDLTLMTEELSASPRRRTTPLQEQICDRLRRLIRDGRMPAGSRAPSLRALATELGVSRGTVVAAYDRLIGEGYLAARGTAGTFVAEPGAMDAAGKPGKPGNAGNAGTPARRPRLATLPPLDRPRAPAEHAATSPRLRASPAGSHAPGPMPLQLGLPALDAFPRKVWARLSAHHARHSISLMKPDPAGLPRLREALVAYLHRSRGVEASARQVFVVAGYEAGLSLAIQALGLGGDDAAAAAAVIEDPGYPPVAMVLARSGMTDYPVPVDADGLITDQLTEAPDNARLAVVTPSHHSPLCMSLSLARRQALLQWANERQAWIVEDDYDGEFRYAGPPLPALKSLDRDDRVLYAGTLSKVLYPGLRLAYLVVPAPLVDRFEAVLRPWSSAGCPALLQEVVADFMERGHFARHIRRMRTLYGVRRSWLEAALSPYAAFGLTHQPQRGGLHLTIGLPEGADDRDCAARARQAGLAVLALSSWCRGRTGLTGLLASFTNIESPQAAHEYVARLATAVRPVGTFGPWPTRAPR
jgi:GntR family transcriptional regulator / MocR family aminotransferase